MFYGKIYRIGILSSSTCNFVNEMGMFNSYPRRSGSYGHRYYMYLQICLTVFVLNIGNYRFLKHVGVTIDDTKKIYLYLYLNTSQI